MNAKQNQTLFKLVREGDIANLQHFLAKEYSNERWKHERHTKSGDSVLHVATRNGHLTLVKWLVLEEGLDSSIANQDGKRSLHDAAQFGHIYCLKFLLDHGAAVDCLKRADWTPLMLACTKTDVSIVEKLIQAGADLHLKNKDGWNCLHIACREGCCEIVKCLLDHDSSMWDVTSKNGRTPLHTAALHGHSGVVSILLDRGHYAIDVRDSCGTTPLMDAARAGYTDVSSTLLQHQADVHSEDAVGRSVLHLAAQAGSIASVQWLVRERGVPVDVKSSVSGITPLHLAAKEGQHQVISLLCSLGADVNITDNKGRTAMHQACGGQLLECVRVLYNNGAVDCMDADGRTARSLVKMPEITHLMDNQPT